MMLYSKLSKQLSIAISNYLTTINVFSKHNSNLHNKGKFMLSLLITLDLTFGCMGWTGIGGKRVSFAGFEYE